MPPPTTDVAIAGVADLPLIERAREALEAIQTVDEAVDIANRAMAAATYYARARETRDLAQRATEIRIWAERRAGEMLMEERVVYHQCADRARDLGTSVLTLRRWMRFARAAERHFAAAIADVIGAERELTVGGVDRRLQAKGLKRIERGIYQNYLGQYLIRWRRDGVSHQSLYGQSLASAREHLLIVTGRAEPRPAARPTPVKDGVAQAYNDLRVILQGLDRIFPSASPEMRREIELACAGLYKAEDALGRALRIIRR